MILTRHLPKKWFTDVYKRQAQFAPFAALTGHEEAIAETARLTNEWHEPDEDKKRELASKMIDDVLKDTGITATCGIGTNLYLCKIAMDIMAKPVSYTHLDVYKRQV